MAVNIRPRRVEGLELLGYEGSGLKQPVYLARRPDGQMLQLPGLLYLLVVAADGRRDVEQLAERVSRESGRRLSPEGVRFLVEERLWPAGVLATDSASQPSLERARPLFALRFRARVVPAEAVHALAGVLRPLFLAPAVSAVIAGLLALDAWVLLDHGVWQSLRQVTREPEGLLVIVALAVASTAFHELGHATACRYGGARPGPIGVGIYFVWPVFYVDLTDAYRLDRVGRLRADLGGIYFNAVFALVTGAAYLATDFEALLLAIVVQQYQMLFQLLPFLRFDGYYVVSDLAGVPDLYARLGALLRSLIPGAKRDRRVEELRPWMRRLVTGYLAATTLAVGVGAAILLVNLPRIVDAARSGLNLNADQLAMALSEGEAAVTAAALIQLLALALPILGILLTLALMASRLHASIAESAGLAGRPLLWPEPGWSARTIAWNLLSLLAFGIATGALILAMLGAAGVVRGVG